MLIMVMMMKDCYYSISCYLICHFGQFDNHIDRHIFKIVSVRSHVSLRKWNKWKGRGVEVTNVEAKKRS